MLDDNETVVRAGAAIVNDTLVPEVSPVDEATKVYVPMLVTFKLLMERTLPEVFPVFVPVNVPVAGDIVKVKVNSPLVNVEPSLAFTIILA